MALMDPRRIASTAAVIGGGGWLLKVFLIWGNGGETTGSEPIGYLSLIGWLGFAMACAAAGYTLVERAPVWLRGVVALATPLLVLMVWELVDQFILSVYPGTSWLRDEMSAIIAGSVAVLMGLWGFGRHRPYEYDDEYYEEEEPPAPARGRRAAR